MIIDSLMADSRWDMKFLACRSWSKAWRWARSERCISRREPLLKQLLKMVIQDEARHVHYGVPGTA